jgi:thiol:disulfide interchange protein
MSTHTATITRGRCIAAIGMVFAAAGALTAIRSIAAEDASIGIQKRQIYPAIESAPADVKAALAQAHAAHKRVILDFGGDWCPDCQVLDIYFHQDRNAALLAKYFVRVNVNVGRLNANQDIAAKYGVPLKGVPALAVLDDDGKVVYAQNKEFSDMRHLDSAALTDFLDHWKP